MIATYWVGQIPAEPLVFEVKDKNGTPKDVTGYTIRLKMLGGRGEQIDTSDGSIVVQSAPQGRLAFHWPAQSLFRTHGYYELQLELSGTGVKDFTNTQSLLVREFGKVIT